MTDRAIKLARPAAAPFRRIWPMLRLWRSRRALSRLDPHLLRDVGLGEAAAAREAARPIWDVPASWRY